ncbi:MULTISPECIES: ExbD/TolR family protein [unclassified Caulobacter]|uniref:ExbD/TolR family protein n=1 Tax=unclassified Caulobacter TaxID=2648921 RepID=UPI000D3C99C0|nr:MULTISPECIES: ExbD/TolR family protein [unclassified Caulobacter]PTS90975.1 protein TolR [Caulobacter sp. HMWF009]PTT06076.1 protein TolR [Caulobacter sp. HMWF025]
MAMSANDAFATGGRRGRRRGRRSRGALSEINVTPLVDVMLVLLIIFMISAPLLTAGVPLELPKTEAAALQNQQEPITVSINREGEIYVGEAQIPFQNLGPRISAIAGDGYDKPIFVRADGAATYAIVAQTMAALSSAGFTKINLITETGGPTSGAAPRDAQPEGAGDLRPAQ